MKKLLIVVISLLLLVNICYTRPMPGPDDWEEFEVDKDGFPKGWFFGKCDGCRVTNIGNGRENTNTVLFEANPIPKPDDSEAFEVHDKDGPRGWDGWIDTCDNCSVTNVGNGQYNTNTIFMKIKK
ncbi:unnamed protein product [Colias eurytheme]|nr:unnamed protein product [Colias eurytheme]